MAVAAAMELAAYCHAQRRVIVQAGPAIGRSTLAGRKASAERLKNVAADSGFSSRNHFYRAFVRVEGVSPKAYRQQRHQEP